MEFIQQQLVVQIQVLFVTIGLVVHVNGQIQYQ
jgi:hypothetical protein